MLLFWNLFLVKNFYVIYRLPFFRAQSKAPNWGLPKPRAHQSNLKAVFRDLRQSTQFTTGWNNLWRSIAYFSAHMGFNLPTPIPRLTRILVTWKKWIPVWVYICDGHWEISIPFITWLTLTGIQFLNGPWVSGMEISPQN